MIERMLFGQGKLPVLKRGLDVYAERGRVHARNIANAETPGYRAQEVQFEDRLRLALRSGLGRSIATTSEGHVPSQRDLPQGRLTPRNSRSVYLENGINDVEVDREMADIAANTMRFTVAAEIVRQAYTGMRKAIRGRQIG